MSASIGARPESPGPCAEESIPASVVVVGVAFLGIGMEVGPVRVRGELGARASLGVLGVKLAYHNPFRDDKRVYIVGIFAESC